MRNPDYSELDWQREQVALDEAERLIELEERNESYGETDRIPKRKTSRATTITAYKKAPVKDNAKLG